jgi:inositol 1,4,5-triphosphate receptor type 3
MKNYIRTQVDSDGRVKTTNFDFIEITNVELRRLFKILDNELVELPLSLIDFLNEVTQLPCIENQITLCKGTFFEDVCLVQKTKTTGEQSEFEKTLLSIFNKSIDIALSCLEGNE